MTRCDETMKPNMKNKLAICFTLTCLLPATMLAADSATEWALIPIGRENSNHLNILVLGDALDESVGSQLQQIATDDFNYFRFQPDREGVLLSETVLGTRNWHGVLLGLRHDPEDISGYVAKLRDLVEQLAVQELALVWPSRVIPGSDAAAVRLNDAARAVMREAGIAVADVRGALLPLSGRAYDATGGLTGPAIKVAAATIHAAMRTAVLKFSTPWAELPPSETRSPTQLLANSSLLVNPNELPLAKGETSVVYRAEEGGWQFNLHSFLTHHEGRFWAIWSTGLVDEDSSSQLVRYATSSDGHHWSEAQTLVDDLDGPDGPLRWMASGVYVEDGRLYALAARNAGWQRDHFWKDASLVRFEWIDGTWQEDQIIADDCVVYFPPLKVDGRDFHVWRNSQGHFATALSRPDSAGWEVTKIPGPFPDYRLSETSHFVDADGILHLIIRDQGRSRFLYHAVSYDGGGTWTIPVKTNYPDVMSKNFADRLSNGWFYLINNPKQDRPFGRDPLTITFSRDGWSFGHPFAVRRDAPPLRYPGKAKGSQSFQYAHAIEHDGKLWVIYATNKEDIEVTSFDLDTFGLPALHP